MTRTAVIAAILIVGCARQPTDHHTAPIAGAILSVQLASTVRADQLMSKVQATLLAHSEWAGQTMSHGLNPPTGYFYKFKGRCGARPAAANAVARLMVEIAATVPQCQEVGP